MDKRRTVRPQRQSTADGQHLKVMYLRNVNHDDLCTHFNKLLHLFLILLAKVKEMRCDARHFHSTDTGLGKKKERKIIKKNLENTFIRLLTIS